ncbi:MAG: hypothetical protein J0I07_42655 [Myxococcales bacterium]|nr:hypothetical protein [Myxococcales bacterium]
MLPTTTLFRATDARSLPDVPNPTRAVRNHARAALVKIAGTPISAAIGITAQVTTSLVLVRAELSIAVLAMVLCVAVGSYAIDHLVDEGKAAGARRWARGSGMAALLLVTAALVAYALRGAVAAAITIVFPLSVAAYCMPWLGVIPALRRRGIARVKDIPYAKNAYTALCVAGAAVWAATTVGVHDARVLVAQGLAMSLSAFVNTAACDLGDVDADRRDGVPTLAVRHGRHHASRILLVIAVCWSVVVAVGTWGGLFAPAGWLIAPCVVVVAATLARLGRGANVTLLADVLPDGTDAFVAFVALIARHVLGG